MSYFYISRPELNGPSLAGGLSTPLVLFLEIAMSHIPEIGLFGLAMDKLEGIIIFK